MPIVSLQDIHVAFGSKVIFDHLNLRLYPHQKVGLVGPNGCGKTTLLKIILGTESSDAGSIKTRRKTAIGYLPQEPQFDDDKTVLGELHCTAEDILQMQRQIDELTEAMSNFHGRELVATMKQYDRLCHEFEACGGYTYENRIKEVAAGLGLDENFYGSKTSGLSGGQKSRLGLAKVLLTGANLLLLDEPTNHLDWDATLWLESFLKSYDGAALIVSHDRFLLDRLVTKIVEISDRRATVFKGNYSNYRKEKEKRDLERKREYQQRVEFVERTRDFIARNKDQEGMSKVARGRKTQLNKLLKENPDFLEKPKSEKELNFSFAPAEQKSKRQQCMLGCEGLTKKYGELVLFKNLDLEVLSGHRLGIIGPNGTGKTTFLKLALGQTEPSSGEVTLKNNTTVGYLDQAGAELNDNNDVLTEASTAVDDMQGEQLRGKLGAFLFSGDDVFKKVGTLSGGERNRLALCKLVLSGPDVLVLDEPTNHLDIPSIEALENALGDYTGTAFIVSHDRFFLEKTVDELLVLGVDELGKKKMGSYELISGTFSRYTELLEKRRSERASTKVKKPKAIKKNAAKRGTTTPQELLQFVMWTDEQFDSVIETTEQQIAELTERFADENVYKQPEQLGQLQQELDGKKRYLELLYRGYERALKR